MNSTDCLQTTSWDARHWAGAQVRGSSTARHFALCLGRPYLGCPKAFPVICHISSMAIALHMLQQCPTAVSVRTPNGVPPPIPTRTAGPVTPSGPCCDLRSPTPAAVSLSQGRQVALCPSPELLPHAKGKVDNLGAARSLRI